MSKTENPVSRVFGFGRRHPVLVISLAVSVLSVSAATLWVRQYDQSTSKTLPAGTVIEGVPVGDLRYDAAVAKVREKVEAPLHRQIQVRTEDFAAQTTPWDLGLRVDVPSSVDKAMKQSREGNMLTRVWSRLTGNGSITTAATPTWGDGQLTSILDRAATELKVEPKSAAIDTSSGFVTISQPTVGRELDLEQSRVAMVDAVKSGQPSVSLVTSSIEPETGADAYSKVILVRTGENKLYLYENGSITKTWPVATGSAEFATPRGIWRVTSKITNPTWTNPGSAWATSMPKTIPPGPNNPLGTKALALNADGILIHATPDTASIGYSVSHGCIRMTEATVAELFGMVPEGTPVAIVNAGPARPRGVDPPALAPEQVAASQF